MSPNPGMAGQILGAVLGELANSPALMKIFDKLGIIKLKKQLKQNPV
jgi:hypothetical protein